MKGFTGSQTLDSLMQFGLAHLSVEHTWYNLYTYALVRMKAQSGRPPSQLTKKCVTEDGYHLESHCLL